MSVDWTDILKFDLWVCLPPKKRKQRKQQEREEHKQSGNDIHYVAVYFYSFHYIFYPSSLCSSWQFAAIDHNNVKIYDSVHM